ncbi:conserved hypothetical protein [Clostridium botulinum C str. Eklund]|nr:conserved hypothetical protein [Clostridium botulinum C str. Eklund]NEZ49327.1 DUF2089 domain-containing protein [Clostridium botulinum]
MGNELIGYCPRCKNKLIATQLTCNECDIELKGNFKLSKFDYLGSEDINFIFMFLKYQGKLKAIQKNMGISYPAAKKKLGKLLIKLEIEPFKEEKENKIKLGKLNYLSIEPDDSLVVKKIKEKLNKCNGKTLIPLFRGNPCDITYDNNGKGVVSSKIPLANQLTWEVFDATVEVVIKNGGKAEKGNAQSGAKLGSDRLSLNSVEGYIASKVHGVEEGKTAFGPGFVVCAILDWAGICKNERGYLSINPGFLIEYNKGIKTYEN